MAGWARRTDALGRQTRSQRPTGASPASVLELSNFRRLCLRCCGCPSESGPRTCAEFGPARTEGHGDRAQGIDLCTRETASCCDRLCRQPPSAPCSPQQRQAAVIEPDRHRSRWFRKRSQYSRSRFRRSGSRASKRREPCMKASKRPLTRRGCAAPLLCGTENDDGKHRNQEGRGTAESPAPL